MAGQPGWHPDPWGQGTHRWWDGEQWTEHLHGTAATPPLALPPRRRGPVIALVLGAALVAVAVIVGVVLLASGGSSGKRFAEPAFNIAFDYPSQLNRQKVSPGNAKAKVSLVLNQQNGIAVSKYEQDNAVNASNINFTRGVLDGVVRQLSEGPQPKGKRVTIDGLPGFEYEFPIRGLSDTRSRSIFLFQGRDEYQLNCQFQPARREDVLKACDKALSTLEVTGPGR